MEGCFQNRNAMKRQVDWASTPLLRKSPIQDPLLSALLKTEGSISTQNSVWHPVLIKNSVSANSPAPKKKAAPENTSVVQTRTVTNASTTKTALGNSSVSKTSLSCVAGRKAVIQRIFGSLGLHGQMGIGLGTSNTKAHKKHKI